MKRKWKNSLAIQLFGFSFGIILSLLAAFMVTNSLVKENVRRSTLELNEKILLQIEGKLKDYYNTMNHIVMALSYSPTAKIYFGQGELDGVISSGDLETVFSNTMLLDEDIMGISLYDMEGICIASMGMETAEKAEEIMVADRMEFGNIYYPGQSGRPYYRICCPVFDLDNRQYGTRIGMCVLVMKTDGLKNYLSDSSATQDGDLYLLDANGEVIASSGEGGLTDFGRDLIQSRETAMRNWRIVSRVPRKELYGGLADGMGLVGIAYGIAGVLLLALTWFCYRNFIRRIYGVDQFIRNLSGNPESRMEEAGGDEIGRVVKSLNQMLDNNAKMNREMQESQKKMYEAELARKQLQVLAYRNQINPHFLYNTFECIRGMALYYDVEEIAEITMALSNVFRFAVKEENIVTVRDEIDYIREYATIIEYRFMDKIEVVIDAEEALHEKKVIKLILQPVVENAVFHGLEQKMEEGEVKVTIRRKWDDYIMFLVEDNGCGMTEEQVRKLLNSLEEKNSRKGIGLANIYQRLKLFYGENVVFEIKSRPGEGTRVMIVVPDHVEVLGTQERPGEA